MARQRNPIARALLAPEKPKAKPVSLQDRQQQLIKSMDEVGAAFQKRHDELKKQALRQDNQRWDTVLSGLERIEALLGDLGTAIKDLERFAEKLPEDLKIDTSILEEIIREALPPPQTSTAPEMTLEITGRDSDGNIQHVAVRPKDAPLH